MDRRVVRAERPSSCARNWPRRAEVARLEDRDGPSRAGSHMKISHSEHRTRFVRGRSRSPPYRTGAGRHHRPAEDQINAAQLIAQAPGQLVRDRAGPPCRPLRRRGVVIRPDRRHPNTGCIPAPSGTSPGHVTLTGGRSVALSDGEEGQDASDAMCGGCASPSVGFAARWKRMTAPATLWRPDLARGER